MKERPILFNGPMVRAILDGSKTQTRRIVKPAGAHHIFQFRGEDEARGADEPTGKWAWCSAAHVVSEHIRCPQGKPGDRLWVREAWRAPLAYELSAPRNIELGTPIFYESGGGTLPEFSAGKYRPPMFMPRWASRITLEVTGVRVERLQQINEADAEAEGFGAGPYYTPRGNFSNLWECIAKPGSHWDANPWVWVVEFKRVIEAA